MNLVEILDEEKFNLKKRKKSTDNFCEDYFIKKYEILMNLKKGMIILFSTL